ncbi:MAG TPA: Ig-like domain-containing protein [Candidatus Saccharimonadales bacterium]|nr:Ig-like domain-containing protein [Candidatus Saccharimonadales bacterium]
MKVHSLFARAPRKTLVLGITALITGVLCVAGITSSRAVAAACQAPSTNFGSGSATVNVTNAGTYRVWSRVMAPNIQDSNYLLEIDGNTCYSVGGGTVTPNTWTWIDYKDSAADSKIDIALSAGNHTLKFIGTKADVKLDKVMFVSDLTCTPVDDGSNCDTPSDVMPPTVSLTAPTEGSTVSGNTNVTANATDNVGITKVQFYANSALIGEDTTAPYSVSWNTTAAPNGTYSIIARAFDSANNLSTDSYSVVVQNGDTQAPTTPSGLTVVVNSATKSTLTWKASTDNVSVKGYTVIRDGSPLANLGAVTTYSDSTLTPGTQYKYQLVAFDAAGNKSAPTQIVAVTTPSAPDTQAPTTPGDLRATTVSASQINLSWQASTDNTSAVTYEIFSKPRNGNATKLGTSTTTSFGVTGLKANTEYSYYVVAKDSAGNTSQASNTATSKTAPKQRRSTLWGTVTTTSGRSVKDTHVIVQTQGKKRVYHANRNGKYVINNLAAGSYTVTYRAPGYVSKSVRLTLGAEAVRMQNITMVKR